MRVASGERGNGRARGPLTLREFGLACGELIQFVRDYRQPRSKDAGILRESLLGVGLAGLGHHFCLGRAHEVHET